MIDKFFSVLAQFDNKTQKKLNGYYNILRQNGFIGNQTKNIPYHFTLGKMDVDCEEQLIDKLNAIHINTDCIDIHFSHIGLFGLNVLFIAPNMNHELLTLQQNLFPHCGNGAYTWTAHTTLLIEEPENILKALPIVAKNFKPFIARIEHIVIYEFFPMRLVKEFALNGKQYRHA